MKDITQNSQNNLSAFVNEIADATKLIEGLKCRIGGNYTAKVIVSGTIDVGNFTVKTSETNGGSTATKETITVAGSYDISIDDTDNYIYFEGSSDLEGDVSADIILKKKIVEDDAVNAVYYPSIQYEALCENKAINADSYTSFDGYGWYELTTKDLCFNNIKLPIYKTVENIEDFTVKVAVLDSEVFWGDFQTIFEPFVVASISVKSEDISISPDKSSSIFSNDIINVETGKYLYIFSDSQDTRQGRFTGQDTTMSRHYFAYVGSSIDPYNDSWIASSGTYYQVPYELYLLSEISTPVQSDWDESSTSSLAYIKNKPTSFEPNVSLLVPDTLYAIVGNEFNIYYDAIVANGFDTGLTSPENYRVDVQCPTLQDSTNRIGVRCNRMWQITAPLLTSTYIGTHELTIRLYSSDNTEIESKTVNLIVSAATPLATTKNIVCIGDSLTDWGGTVTALGDNFVSLGGTQPTFWGTKSNLTYNTEGHSGWTFGSFLNSSSPFYNPNTYDIDFTYYRDTTLSMGGEKFDIVGIQLGTNDCIGNINDMSASVTNAKTLVDEIIRDADTYDTKIIIQLTTPDANTLSGWQLYGDQSDIGLKESYQENMWNLRELLLAEFTKVEYLNKVFIGQASLGIDRFYGYPYEERQSASRIVIDEIYHTNCVHPNSSGYGQLGDGHFLQVLNLLNN